ncbi:MAG: hypothetical protein KIS85_02275 [Anaerolineales bacterium]|nr:hypothetical protein [Anaerolineales bacterium]
MVNLTEARAKELCIRLLKAELEEEVVDILKKFNLWEDRSVWKPYGDIANNRGIVSNQQSEPVAALVEKLVNSIDAVLTLECYRSGADPKSAAAPQTMKEAAERFFKIQGGKIQTLSPKERTSIAERVQLVVCGTKESPAYMIVDDGEGQEPDQFPNTFLSLVKENKSRIPFVQGKFNMGGTGVLQFSGQHSFQLVISRRNPGAPTNSSDKDKWGFTLIRRIHPDKEHPHSMYVFLAPDEKILRFTAASLPLKPGKYPQPYEGDLEYGSCIKVWNYKLRKGLKTIATLDLRYALEQFLPEPVLPIRICERRQQYKANSYETTMSGISAVLADENKIIEFSDTTPLIINQVGEITIRTVVIQEIEDSDSRKRYPAGIYYSVNGQLQGSEDKNFVARKTKFDYLASSLFILADCTNLPPMIREDLFMASRDRMRAIDEKSLIEDAIIEHLKDHPMIRQLNAIRRQRRQESAISQEETAKIFQNLVRSDPSLANLFGKGSLIRVPGKGIAPTEPFEGKKFPTYFRIRKEPKGGLVKDCSINQNCRIEFETDAENGYFDRLEDPGHIACQGLPQKLSQSLGDGKAILKFGLPANSSVGDEFKVRVTVSDVSRAEPFVAEFRIRVQPESKEIDPPATPPSPKGAKFAGIPKITRVYRNEWAIHDFNEISALRINNSGEDDDTFDIAINMDNIYLHNEIVKRKQYDAKLMSYWFEIGLVLLVLGIINSELKRREENADEREHSEETIFERVSRASEGLAITLIPVLIHLSNKDSADI